MKKINTYILEKLSINKKVATYNYFPKTKKELINDIKEKIEKYGLGTAHKPLSLNDIYTGKITDMSELFDASYDGELNKLSKNGYFDISKWNVGNVVNMKNMFCMSAFDEDISEWDVKNVKYMNDMFAHSSFSGDLSKWKPVSIKNMDDMFIGTSLQSKPPKWYRTHNYFPKDKNELIKIIKTKIKEEGVGTVDNPLNLNDIDTSKIEDMSYLFGANLGHDGYKYFPNIRGDFYFNISKWDVGSVKNMKCMFRNSKFNGDLSRWDVSNVEDMSFMFAGSSFAKNISYWKVDPDTNTSNMFMNCPLYTCPARWYKYKQK